MAKGLLGKEAFVFCTLFCSSVLIYFYGLKIQSLSALKADIYANKLPALASFCVVCTMQVLIYLLPDSNWQSVLAVSSIVCPTVAATGYLYMRWADQSLKRFHRWIKNKIGL